jgi:hypothetical protein
LTARNCCGDPPLRPTDGVADEDIAHALEHVLATEDAGEDPDRWLAIGPDRAANLLEIIVLVTDTHEIAVHAMPMRPQYRRLLKS